MLINTSQPPIKSKKVLLRFTLEADDQRSMQDQFLEFPL